MSSKTCFIISPIGSETSETRIYFDKVRRHIIEPVVSELGYSTIRADEIPKPGTITKQIIEHLVNDDLVIADLTLKNPNVFYELAVRHAVGKPVILMGAIGDTIPFDLAAQRVIFYNLDPDNIVEAKEELTRQISSVESKKFIVDSPIESSIALEQPKTNNDKQGRIEAILENLSIQLRRIESRPRAEETLETSRIDRPNKSIRDFAIYRQFIKRILAEAYDLTNNSFLEHRYLGGVTYYAGDSEEFMDKLRTEHQREPVDLYSDENKLILWFVRENRFVAWTPLL